MKHINFILLMTFVIGVAFEIIPKQIKPPFYELFFFVSDKQTCRAHIYYICEHLKQIANAVVIMFSPPLTLTIKWYSVLSVCDLLNYIAFDDSIWLKLGWFPISFNTVSVIIFGIVIIHEHIEGKWKLLLSRLLSF